MNLSLHNQEQKTQKSVQPSTYSGLWATGLVRIRNKTFVLVDFGGMDLLLYAILHLHMSSISEFS